VQALILSAGTSSRLGDITKNYHKCLLDIQPGFKILDNQLVSLRNSNINEIIIVVGYKAKTLIDYVQSNYSDLNVIFVTNKDFSVTNCIYSLWLSREYLNDDLIYLTGDLVMDTNLILEMCKSKNDLILTRNIVNGDNRDFCARISNGLVKEVSVNLTGNGIFPCLPIMKLSIRSVNIWIEKADDMIKKGLVNEYEMAALNGALNIIQLYPYFSDTFCMEVDEKKDLIKLRTESNHSNLGIE